MKWLFNKFGYKIYHTFSPEGVFHVPRYLRSNARRLEHLASLELATAGLTVLEVGAGIGDLTSFYVDRGCQVTATDARLENLVMLRENLPEVTVAQLDVEAPSPVPGAPFDIVHCYGLLYHVTRPGEVLEFLASQCRGRLVLETCVSFGSELEIHPVKEDTANPSQANSGWGCRPTRPWVFTTLRKFFRHVYVPLTQPNHELFPIDWTAPEKHRPHLKRAVFVASHEPLASSHLSETLQDHQARQI